jgi:hypothetical protein
VNNRYLKAVLTFIALELLWLAAIGPPRPVEAQPGPMRVILTGVALDSRANDALPVDVTNLVTIIPEGPVKVEADRPLLVESVPYTPSPRPGE